MFSAKFRKAFSQAINYGYFWGFIPIYYDNSKDCLRVTESQQQEKRCFFTILNLLFYWTFLVGNITYRVTHGKLSVRSYWLLTFFGLYSWNISTAVSIWLRRNELCTFFNEMMNGNATKNLEKLTLETLEKRPGKKTIRDWQYIPAMFYNILFVASIIVTLGMFFVDRRGHAYFYSYYPYEETLWGLIFFLILESYWKGMLVYFVIENFYVMTPYLIYAWSGIQILRESKIDAEKKLRVYHQIELLNKIQSGCFMKSSMPFTLGTLGYNITLGGCSAIRLYGIINIFDYFGNLDQSVACSVILYGLLHGCGNVPLQCERFKLQFEKSASTKYWKQKGKSLEVFGIRSIPIPVLKHNAIFYYFEAIQDYMVTILVAVPDVRKFAQ